MTDAIKICEIPGNSDIAGIGVRASVYAQACLAGFNLLYMLHTLAYSNHGKPHTVEDIEMQPSGSSNSQATVHVASNDTAIGTIQMPSPTPIVETTDETQISLPTADPANDATLDPTLPPSSPSSNRDIKQRLPDPMPLFLKDQAEYLSLAKALERSLFMIGFAVILSAILEAKSNTGLNAYHALIVLNISQINNWAGFLILSIRGELRNTGIGWLGRIFLTRKSLISPGFILYTAHAMLMSGLGLYFWSNQTPFLAYASSAPQQPCQAVTYFWLFGSVEVSSRSLRIASLVFYAISIVPILGLYLLLVIAGGALLSLALPTISAILLLVIVGATVLIVAVPIIVFVTILVFRPIFRIPFIRKIVSKLEGPLSVIARKSVAILGWLHSFTAGRLLGPGYAPFFTFTIGIFYSAPLVYFMVSTELIIDINKKNVQAGAENKWTYGQTLALFSALVAISLYVYELYFLMRKKRRSRIPSAQRPKLVSRYIQTGY